ncbi:MAG: urease accessory protein [Alphaproteobacteria bacterium]
MSATIAIFSAGLVIGMQHAMEADHVAAVSTIATREKSFRGIVGHGATWGLGHTVTLVLLAGGALLFGRAIPDSISHILEAAVGVMLVGLGLHVLIKLAQERIHFHRHRHQDGTVHLHAHSHKADPETAHHAKTPAHDHAHPAGLPWRTLLVGMVHGLAGSAALLVLAAASISDPLTGVVYVALFGVGSILGMAALSAVMAVPLIWTAKAMTWVYRSLQTAAGAVTAGLGAWVLYSSASAL